MRILTAVTLLLLLSAATHVAQGGSHGDPSGLKGGKRIYVEAGAKESARIVAELRKSKAGVEVVDAPGAAELILLFTADKVRAAAGMEKKPNVLGNYPDPQGVPESRRPQVNAAGSRTARRFQAKH